MSDHSGSSFPPASPYPDSASAAAAAAAAAYEPMPLPYGLDSIAPSSMSALTAEKLEKFRVGSQTKSRFQIEKEEKEGGAWCPTDLQLYVCMLAYTRSARKRREEEEAAKAIARAALDFMDDDDDAAAAASAHAPSATSAGKQKKKSAADL